MAPNVGRGELLRKIAIVAGIVVAVVFWLAFTFRGVGDPVDAHAYYVANPDHLYGEGLAHDAFLYSPAFAMAMLPFQALPLAAFVAIWRAAELAAVVVLAGPFAVLALLAIPVASEVNAGNVQLLIALAIVAGFRWPAAWSFVLLTKPTCAVALLWYVVRREWAPLRVMFLTTAILGAVSFAWNPQSWFDYAHLLFGHAAPSTEYPSFWVRLPLALVVAFWGARTGRRWTVPVTALIALPVMYHLSFALLVGCLAFAWPNPLTRSLPPLRPPKRQNLEPAAPEREPQPA